MKKLILCFGLLCCLVFISGCDFGGERVVCTGVSSEGGINENIEVVAIVKNDVVSKVSATMTYNNENDMNTICSSLKSANSINSAADRISFSCNKTTIKINNFDKMLLLSNVDVINHSKAEFIEKMSQDQLNCS